VTEAQWQSQVVQLAKLYGWRVYHTHDSRRSEPGFPDLVLVRERVVYAELKTEKGKTSPHQKAWVQALTEAGQEVYLWRPADLEYVSRTLRR
jgi:hypothetical protein